MFKLVIQDDEGKTTVVPLIRDEITIGRKEGNTIRLTERNVSRRHARIVRQNGEVQIEDLGSYNGIRVNNARIAERVALRVSDQVQIGDYKLYLKAEGVEQVDDARTMPIERIDTPTPPGNATDILPAVSPPGNGTPTMPMGVPQTPPALSGLAAGQQLVGAPNRTQVAIADTDPAGRPVASAAAVAALTPQVGGPGKLVVVSSNFAGKEFELTRPQMIVGRTDENDLVINHRSISRNHAKVVRDTDTGRYTISDLQSSNGVRVNGQDYGKVELRRGDTVDLGHVRLRFVEPGEDFVFARDAVITDVPEAGGKKGLLVAVLLGLVVVGGVGVVMMTRGGSGSSAKGKVVEPAGSGSARVAAGTGAEDGSGSGSDTVVAVNPPTVDAGPVTPPANDDVKLECLKLQADRSWGKLRECSDRLVAADGDAAKEFATKAAAEIKAELTVERMKKALGTENYKVALVELEKIPEGSVYRREAEGTYEQAATPAIDDYERRAQEAAGDEKCAVVDKLIREATAKGVADKAKLVKCTVTTTAVVKNPTNAGSGSTVTNKVPDPGPGSGTTTVKPAECDAEALKAKGEEQFKSGMFGAALQFFESSMKCKTEGRIVQLAYLAACRARNAPKAKLYFGKLGAPGSLAQVCLREGITVP